MYGPGYWSRLYRIEGSESTKNPFLLCAHLDVVPPGEDNWSHDPFSAGIEEIDGKVQYSSEISAYVLSFGLCFNRRNMFTAAAPSTTSTL